jgi:tetratricopeptide (TPR) repeat protein
MHGNVHVHSASEGYSVVPRQLLPPPPHFTGRHEELSTLDEMLEGGPPTVIVVKGQGGVGKTALALSWLDRIRDRFPDGQLYADLTHATGEPVAPEDVLGQFLRSLDVAPHQVPAGLSERTALYRSVTAERALIVLLDNVFSAGQARVLLPASATGVTVVTSRRTLLGLLAEGAHVVQVDPLDHRNALALLTARVGERRIEQERGQAETLTALCGGLPIALCVAGARVAARPRRSLARMVDELTDERARLDGLSAEGDLSVRATFDVAYAGLPDRLQRSYRTLGLHPGPAFGVEAAAAMTGTEPREARDILEDLVDASLLEELDENSYRFHDLVRVHALDQALEHDSEETRTRVARRILEWYLAAAQDASHTVMPARRVLRYEFSAGQPPAPTNVSGHHAALNWLERQRPNLVAATHDAVQHDLPKLAYHLADALQPLFILHQHNREEVEIGELALRAAQQLGDNPAQNNMRKRLARTYTYLGHIDRAEHHIDEMLSRCRANGDRSGEASALKSLALLLVKLGRLGQAVGIFERTLELLRVLGKRRGEGLVLINLGETLVQLEDTQLALERLQRARDILASLGDPDPYNEARATAALGNAHLQHGDHEVAREALQHALDLFADQGSPRERGRAHESLAELGRRTGNDEEARRHDDIAGTLLAAPETPPD